MPDLLSPTNPVPGYDSAGMRGTPVTPRDTNIKNIVDPSRVIRPDSRAEQQNAGDAAFRALRYESSFLSFIQRLKSAPELTGALTRLIQGEGMQITSGVGEGLAAELAQLAEFLRMDEGQLLAFLQEQMRGGTRFGGPLFQLLRGAYSSAQSEVLQSDILQFLRRYSDFSSTGHLESKMGHLLDDMAGALPARWADQLLALIGQFKNGVAAQDRQGNLKLLRDQLFPLISNYVGRTHDHGRARELLSLLTLDVARYENGAEAGVVQAFRQLIRDRILPEELGALEDGEILRLLRENDFTARANLFADRLAAAIEHALRGEGGSNAQEAFRNILSSVLINESVFMPLNHLMLPIEWEDRAMFSELWIDPEAEPEKRGQQPGGTRILIKMDIQGVGAFDLLLNAQPEQVSLQVACPEAVAPFSDEVSREMRDILTRNGLNAGNISVAAMKRPMAISEAFPKLFEGVSGINVKI